MDNPKIDIISKFIYRVADSHFLVFIKDVLDTKTKLCICFLCCVLNMDKLMIVVLLQAISLFCLNNGDLYNEETDRAEVG